MGSAVRIFGGGHGTCRKKTDPVRVPALAQRRGEGDQVIVVDPNNVVGPKQPVQRAFEVVIDAEITAQIAAREFGEVEPTMQDRSQHAVGEAVVKLLVVVAAKSDRHVRDAVVRGGPGSASRVRPFQPNQTPPRRDSAGRIATSRPPARAPSPGIPTRLDTTTSRANSISWA